MELNNELKHYKRTPMPAEEIEALAALHPIADWVAKFAKDSSPPPAPVPDPHHSRTSPGARPPRLYGKLDPATRSSTAPSNVATSPARKKGRKPSLSDAQVRSMRSQRESGLSVALLAKQFGKSPTYISHILHRRSYAHVE